MKAFLVVLVVLAAAAVASAQNSTDFGSYLAQCDGDQSVTFVNFPHRDCVGTPTKKQDPLGQCGTSLASLTSCVNSTHGGDSFPGAWDESTCFTSCISLVVMDVDLCRVLSDPIDLIDASFYQFDQFACMYMSGRALE
jgi:hypothetical protein